MSNNTIFTELVLKEKQITKSDLDFYQDESDFEDMTEWQAWMVVPEADMWIYRLGKNLDDKLYLYDKEGKILIGLTSNQRNVGQWLNKILEKILYIKAEIEKLKTISNAINNYQNNNE